MGKTTNEHDIDIVFSTVGLKRKGVRAGEFPDKGG